MNEETYNYLLKRAREGGLGAMGDGGGCVYRSGDRCCAVGSLLPPDLPLSQDENRLPVLDLVSARGDVLDALLVHGVSLEEAEELQRMHDELTSTVLNEAAGEYLSYFAEERFVQALTAWYEESRVK